MPSPLRPAPAPRRIHRPASTWLGFRTDRAPEVSPGCKIKGNISSKGERIYHLPGQENYDRTRISERKGERWFCSENEARAAGWRKAKR
ncbi:sunset domain-containing protein [Aquamicrobium terrae]